MNTVIAFLANDLLFVMAAVALLTWLVREDRQAKVNTVAVAVIGLVLAGILMLIASHVHHDPRPFVQNPALHPLISHNADDGFPSDHSVAAGFLAAVVISRHRLIGIALAVCAIVVAGARVAAHVHHVQDVVAGLAIGAIGVWIATLLVAKFVAPQLVRFGGGVTADGQPQNAGSATH